MSLFEDISVIPVYQGVVRIYDSEKDHCWDEQVYLGLSLNKAQSDITASTTSDWPKTATVVGFIRFYQIRPNGEFCFLMEKWE